jgi:hypothetical protein
MARANQSDESGAKRNAKQANHGSSPINPMARTMLRVA